MARDSHRTVAVDDARRLRPALLVFLAEGDSLIKTDVKPGLYLILAAIIVLTTAYWLVMSANRRDSWPVG